MARLAKHKNIIGVKDATANLRAPLHTRRACGDDFCQLSGEDHTALASWRRRRRLHQRHRQRRAAALRRVPERVHAGDFKTALALQDRLMPLHEVLFVETNPGPVKYAVSRLGMADADAPADGAAGREVEGGGAPDAMVHASLIN